MWLRAGCELAFEVSVETPFIFMLRPRSGYHQWVARETYALKPSVPVVEFTDMYGNLCQRLIAPVGDFSLRTSFDVMTSETIDVQPGAPFIQVQNLPVSALAYLLPSRYCESDRFGKLASEVVFGAGPGYDQVARISEWIGENVNYMPGFGDNLVSAVEVKEQGFGVCRDLAHLGIALSRALSIPARLVVGYLHRLSPMDIHAWFEAYVGGRWYTFDPTQNSPRGGRIAVAYGRDAADVAISNQFGPAIFPVSMKVAVDSLEGPPE